MDLLLLAEDLMAFSEKHKSGSTWGHRAQGVFALRVTEQSGEQLSGDSIKMWRLKKQTVLKAISYDRNNFTVNIQIILNRPSCRPKLFPPFWILMLLTTHLDGCQHEKDSIWHSLFSQNYSDLNIYVVIERKELTGGFVRPYVLNHGW